MINKKSSKRKRSRIRLEKSFGAEVFPNKHDRASNNYKARIMKPNSHRNNLGCKKLKK